MLAGDFSPRGTFGSGLDLWAERDLWGFACIFPLDSLLVLLDRLISRLPTNDRPRLRTYAHQLLAATTALGVARVIRAGLPIRCDSSNRVLPTPGDAIPSNGLPPRPPPGQFRSRSPDRTTPFLATNHPANTPDSPESPRFILRESPPDQPVAIEEANQPISPCNGDAISASVRIIARSLQHRRVAWMHDFRDSPTRRSSHSTNPEVERRRPRRDTAPPNFRVFKVSLEEYVEKSFASLK